MNGRPGSREAPQAGLSERMRQLQNDFGRATRLSDHPPVLEPRFISGVSSQSVRRNNEPTRPGTNSTITSNTSSMQSEEERTKMAAVHLGLRMIVLPCIRHVVDREIIKYLKEHGWTTLENDPVKGTRLNHRKVGSQNAAVNDKNALAYLFLDSAAQHHMQVINLDTCKDVRAFLKITRPIMGRSLRILDL